MSIKDARGHADEAHVRRRPIIIRRRCPAGEPDHPLCPYDAMTRAWRVMCEEVPVAARAATCFFRTDHGAPVTTDDVRIGVREVVSTLRLGPPHEWGAKAPRIGGATDLLGALGLEKAQRLLKSRGRWCSEIWQIYARLQTGEQVAASAAMQHATGRCLESLVGWVQPAERYD